MELQVKLCSHHFVVTNITARAKPAINKFAHRNVHWGLIKERGRFKRAPLKVFAAATKDRTEFRFHINQYKEFLESLKLDFITEDMIEVVKAPEPNAVPVEIKIFDSWVVRDYQEPVIKYINADDRSISKLITLGTGLGKSFSSMKAASDFGYRTAYVFKPMYIEKWLIDIEKTLDVVPEDIMVVQGSDQLMKLTVLARDNDLKAKVLLISNKTMLNWFKLYEEHKEGILDMGYACVPGDFFEHIGVGLRIIDEVHQDFHFNFKLDLYTHVKNSASLSATMLSDDDFINNMYEIAYPSYLRYKAPPPKKYIAARSVIYSFMQPDRYKWSDWATKRYSHHVLEKSIMRQKTSCQHYMELIRDIAKDAYLKKYAKGDKLIIFCASIDFATLLTNFLKKEFFSLDVRRYVEEDPYENLMEADIRVTTLLSAGTAVDIPQLTTTILTTAVMSSQSNVQGLGRLRELKDGRTPEFIYLTCSDIPKQMDYHVKKMELLKERVKSFRVEYAGRRL